MQTKPWNWQKHFDSFIAPKKMNQLSLKGQQFGITMELKPIFCAATVNELNITGFFLSLLLNPTNT